MAATHKTVRQYFIQHIDRVTGVKHRRCVVPTGEGGICGRLYDANTGNYSLLLHLQKKHPNEHAKVLKAQQDRATTQRNNAERVVNPGLNVPSIFNSINGDVPLSLRLTQASITSSFPVTNSP